MGYKNSCFIGQSASEMTYSQESLLKFLEMKGWTLNSENFLFEDISDILIVYCDDICIFSPDNIPNAEKIHKNVIEYVLWTTIQHGFKIGKSKFEPFVTRFKFLGHFFDVARACKKYLHQNSNIFEHFEHQPQQLRP